MVALSILQKVDNERLMRATEGLTSGAFTVTITSRTDREIRGFVANGDGKEYGVGIGEYAFCSCPDSMYRKAVCKHAVALALFVIRHPQTEAKEEEPRPYNLRLAKVRPAFVASA